MSIVNNNRIVRVKRGETGFVLAAKLKDAAGKAVNLTAGGTWTVAISATLTGSTDNLLDGSSMTPDADQTENGNRGICTYVFTEDDALLDAGDYDLEITATDPDSRVHKFPKVDGAVFGTLRMMPSKYVAAP